MSDCPNCGWFVGPDGACPHCDAVPKLRPVLRLLKYGVPLLALLGALMLSLCTRREPIPGVSLAAIDSTMDHACLHVAGRVSRQPVLEPEHGTLSFWVDDGTAELNVVVYRRETETLRASGMVPRLGDQVGLDGTVRLQDDLLSMTLDLPASLHINRPQVETIAIGKLEPSWAGRSVEVMGVVRWVRYPHDGLTLVTLRDATGAVEIAISQDVLDLTGDLDLNVLELAAPIRVAGVVTLDEGQPQVSLVDVADAALLPVVIDFAPVRAIGELGAESVGQYARLSGQVVNVSQFSAGLRLELDDGSGAISVLLWRELADAVASDVPLAAGVQLMVVGEITETRGALEIIPETGADITLIGRSRIAADAAATPCPQPTPFATMGVTITPFPTATPAGTRLGELGVANIGEIHTVAAQVVAADSFSAGFKFLLDDGSGRITLLLWSERYAMLADRAQLRPGAQLLVTGQIGVYQGELQLEPIDDGLSVIQGGDDPVWPLIATGELGALLGQTAMIKGRIVDLESFGGNHLRLLVDDGSGAVQVILWHTVFQFIPAEWLVLGSELQVTGVVGEYDGALQLVPALPVFLAPVDSVGQ